MLTENRSGALLAVVYFPRYAVTHAVRAASSSSGPPRRGTKGMSGHQCGKGPGLRSLPAPQLRGLEAGCAAGGGAICESQEVPSTGTTAARWGGSAETPPRSLRRCPRPLQASPPGAQGLQAASQPGARGGERCLGTRPPSQTGAPAAGVCGFQARSGPGALGTRAGGQCAPGRLPSRPQPPHTPAAPCHSPAAHW